MRINSSEYWDERFSKDWEEYGGGEQSRYFARILIESLPDWIKKEIRTCDYSVCDWGCAQGDGTDIFSSSLAKRVTGIDFSKTAIQHASLKYPSCSFKSYDFLSEDFSENINFDVMISSNTLEHFPNPFDILTRLQLFTNKLIILSVPYEEEDRIKEHDFTFLSDNIPLVMNNEWVLFFHRVVNCKEHEKSFWPGKQIVLVYCHINYLLGKKLYLSDIQVSSTYDVRFLSEKVSNISLEVAMLREENRVLKLNEKENEKQMRFLRDLNDESVYKKFLRKIRKVFIHD